MQICPNCNYANRPGVVFCENCGTSLIGGAASIDTHSLDKGKEKPPADDKSPAGISIDAIKDAGIKGTSEFPKDGVIVLEFGEGTDPVILPGNKTILFGRRDPATGSIPDVDLTLFAGYRMGVSRRHAEIRPATEGSALDLWDLGSSNGSFINGDRLISHRGYRLSDGDEIRFGQLSVNIYFRRRVEVQPPKPTSEETETAPLQSPVQETTVDLSSRLRKPTVSETSAADSQKEHQKQSETTEPDTMPTDKTVGSTDPTLPSRPVETASADSAEAKQEEAKPAEVKPADSTETKQEEAKPAEVKPADNPEVKKEEEKPTEAKVETDASSKSEEKLGTTDKVDASSSTTSSSSDSPESVTGEASEKKDEKPESNKSSGET